MQRLLMTINESSEYSGIGRNTLRTLIGWGCIPATKIGNKIVIRTETLDKFISVNEGKDLKNKYELIAV